MINANAGFKVLVSLLFCLFSASEALAQAKIMQFGEAHGQLIYLTTNDIMTESPKFQNLYALSIPVFEELPAHMSVVAGAITLKQQNQNSHIQLKSKARHTPNLDISELPGGLQNELLKPFKDGDWVHMLLGKDGSISIKVSTEQNAIDFAKKRVVAPVTLKSNLIETRILSAEELTWQDADKVGSKAANYAELAKVLNSAQRIVVRPGFAIPFSYYQEFINQNPTIKSAIEQILRDPLMSKVAKPEYRERKLLALRNLMLAPDNLVSQNLIDNLLAKMDQFKTPKGLPRKMKLRSSTNSEDLPNFNGTGLYDSESYKPTEKDAKSQKEIEKPRDLKVESLKSALRIVWASVWNRRAFDERTLYSIPHGEVKMGIQVNLSFKKEIADGVLITKNVAQDSRYTGHGVYLESQRGDKFSVANPEPGTHPERVLVLIDKNNPLDQATYQIKVLQRSNIADDSITILPQDNPNSVMTDEEMKDLVFQSLKAEAHFKNLVGKDNHDFSLDIEFKVDADDTKSRQVYLKQARPYLN
ncbi:MAG: PEP/pyruvate-binding domain-containing protein [Oligoflexia bacterium]|nr:PEP/pyruvate-binding domain-containing protein [Oligoflexia bacterium]